jgi:hypothetical protein
MDDPYKYWPKWLNDLADQRMAEAAAAARAQRIRRAPVEQLPGGCIVYRPAWARRTTLAERYVLTLRDKL